MKTPLRDTCSLPTPMRYGLGANGLDPEAVLQIFEAKGRLGASCSTLHALGWFVCSEWLRRQFERFWGLAFG